MAVTIDPAIKVELSPTQTVSDKVVVDLPGVINAGEVFLDCEGVSGQPVLSWKSKAKDRTVLNIVENSVNKAFVAAVYEKETGKVLLPLSLIVAENEKQATLLAGRQLPAEVDIAKAEVLVRPF